MKNNQSGRSMIEMLGVLAIVGVLSVGGVMGYSKAMGKFKTDQTVTQMAELSIGIRNLFFQQKEFTGLDERMIINAGLVSNRMLLDTSNSNASLGSLIVNPFGGNFRVFPSPGGLGRDNAFEIYADKLSREACITLASNDWGNDPASGLVAVYAGAAVGGVTAPLMTTVYAGAGSNPSAGIFTPGKHENSLPISPMVALSACACSNNDCIFGLKYQ